MDLLEGLVEKDCEIFYLSIESHKDLLYDPIVYPNLQNRKISKLLMIIHRGFIIPLGSI